MAQRNLLLTILARSALLWSFSLRTQYQSEHQEKTTTTAVTQAKSFGYADRRSRPRTKGNTIPPLFTT